MKRRIIFLLIVLSFRFILGFCEVAKFRLNRKIKVTGNIFNVIQTNANCIINVGRFFVDYRNDCTFSQGDRVAIVGSVRRSVIDSFLGRLWLDSAEIYSFGDVTKNRVLKNKSSSSIELIREKIVANYLLNLPEPESGMVAGIVFGYKKDIGQEFYNQMVNSGTIHIAVASGYNIMLVGGTVLSICLWIAKRRFASIVAILMMILYAVEAGGEPPVVRAVIMGAVAFMAASIGRKTISWWILLVTGWVMILFDPWQLTNASFQLSMAASAGLMILDPWLNKLLSVQHERLAGILGGTGLITSLSTMITTMPIILWRFGRVSSIGIVSNLLILPLIPILMILGVGLQVFPGIFSWPTYAVAHWIVEVIRYFGS